MSTAGRRIRCTVQYYVRREENKSEQQVLRTEPCLREVAAFEMTNIGCVLMYGCSNIPAHFFINLTLTFGMKFGSNGEKM